MRLSDFCIKRPAFTIVISLIILVVGMLAYKNLPVSWLPRIVVPTAAVNIGYPGASAATVESSVTSVVEKSLNDLTDVNYITSWSTNGKSTITVYFNEGADLNASVSDIRAAVYNVLKFLPKDIDPPNISKRNPQARPNVIIAFTDNSMSTGALTNYINKFLIPNFTTIKGVGNVGLVGGNDLALRVWFNPEKMAAYGVSIDSVVNKLRAQNIAVPSGQIREKQRYFTVISNFKLRSPKQFSNIVIKSTKGHVVRLKDIANVRIGPVNPDTLFHMNKQPGVALMISAQSDANPLSMSESVVKYFNQIKSTLPQGMDTKIIYNQAIFTRASITNVFEALFEATILVLVIVWLFLGSWREASIPIVTIPICLIGVFAIIAMFDFSINTMTLLAMVLAIGLVVDDAIVMLENIARYVEEGMSPIKAAIQGSKEVGFAVIAMTITIAAIYVPLGFATGLTAGFFREFAFTITGAVIISGIVALTLSPMMCSKMLRTGEHSKYKVWLESALGRMTGGYRRLLSHTLQKRITVILILIAFIALGAVAYKQIPSIFAPHIDQDYLEGGATLPPDISFNIVKRNIPALEKVFASEPDITNYIVNFGDSPDKINFFIKLKPRKDRKLTDLQIAQNLQQKVNLIPDLKTSIIAPPPPLATVGNVGAEATQLQMAVTTAGSYTNLKATFEPLLEKMRQNPGLTDVDDTLKWNTEQANITIDRDKAADLNIPMKNINSVIATMLGGQQIGYYEYQGDNYYVIGAMDLKQLNSLKSLEKLYVNNDQGKAIPLSNVATLTVTNEPNRLLHFQRLRADALVARMKPGYTLGQAIPFMQNIANHLPANYSYSFGGIARSYLAASGTMGFLFTLAIVFIYLVMVAQFESFIDPFIILLTVPFAVVGALFAMWAAGTSLNFFSQVGFITLIGLIAKNGILIVDFANAERENGKGIIEAVTNAASLRLRPILMTASAMVLGTLPLALATGPGSENLHQIGWVIVGGLSIGTFFSLFVVPVAYTYLAKFKKQPVQHAQN